MIDTCYECPFFTVNDGDFDVYLGCDPDSKVKGTCERTGEWVVDPNWKAIGCLFKPMAELPDVDLDI